MYCTSSSKKKIDKSLEVYVDNFAKILISKAKCGHQGVYWRINSSGYFYSDENFIPERSLYYGVGGILLFILEHYRFKNDKKYANILNEGARWLYNQSLAVNSPGFFGGRCGIIFILLEIYKTTKENALLDWSCEIVATGLNKKMISSNNLYNGISGELLGLTHLLRHTSAPIVRELLQQNLDELFTRAKTLDGGVFWDDASLGLGNLTFMGGNLGIHFALNELWLVTSDPEIGTILGKTERFLRSMQDRYPTDNSNWNWSFNMIFPDLINEKSGNFASSNLRTDRTNPARESNFLANGLAGKGLLALEIKGNNKSSTANEHIYEIANRILYNTQNGILPPANCGLFNGATGIAYFFAKILAGGATIIRPTVESQGNVYNWKPICIDDEAWLRKSLPTTVSVLKQNLDDRSFRSLTEINKGFELNPSIFEMSMFKNLPIREIYEIDLQKKAFERRNLFVDQSSLFVRMAKARGLLNNGKILSYNFSINPIARRISLNSETKRYFGAESLFICVTTLGIRVYPLNKADLFLLSILDDSSSSLGSKLKTFRRVVEHTSAEEKELYEFFLASLKRFILREIILLEESSWKKYASKLAAFVKFAKGRILPRA